MANGSNATLQTMDGVVISEYAKKIPAVKMTGGHIIDGTRIMLRNTLMKCVSMLQ